MARVLIQILVGALASSLLVACIPLENFKPLVIDVTDQSALDRDSRQCLQVAEGYKPGLDVGQIASATAQGASGNLANAVINPLVPAFGAAGGAATATLQGFGLLDASQKRVLLRCLEHRGMKSGAYNLVDPNL